MTNVKRSSKSNTYVAGIKRSSLKTQIKRPVPLEADEQKALVKWLTLKGILFYHIPNGGRRNLLEGHKLKLLGVSAGVPDICIPMPSGIHHALYIEMKRVKGGKVSPEQEAWIMALRMNGNYVGIAHGFAEAIEIVTHYFNIK